MKFNNIQLTEWQQFKKIDIEFHPKVTIITGANGSGKSTILKFLSTHFGWNLPFLATPLLSPRQGIYTYKPEYIPMIAYPSGTLFENTTDILGEITYSDQDIAHIMLNSKLGNSPLYNFYIHNQQTINGLHINSHRPTPKYQKLESIPTNPMNAENAYEKYFNETISFFHSNHSSHSPIYKTSFINHFLLNSLL